MMVAWSNCLPPVPLAVAACKRAVLECPSWLPPLSASCSSCRGHIDACVSHSHTVCTPCSIFPLVPLHPTSASHADLRDRGLPTAPFSGPPSRSAGCFHCHLAMEIVQALLGALLLAAGARAAVPPADLPKAATLPATFTASGCTSLPLADVRAVQAAWNIDSAAGTGWRWPSFKRQPSAGPSERSSRRPPPRQRRRSLQGPSWAASAPTPR